MDAEFWLERWREGRTHFHQARITPPLERFWPTLQFAPGSRILVPLCGKSLDGPARPARTGRRTIAAGG